MRLKHCTALLLCMFTSVVLAGKPLVLHIPDHAKRFVVTLPTNPTTGYQLKLKHYDNRILSLVSERFRPSNTKHVGAAGLTIFMFERKDITSKQNTTELLFAYSRPWEKDKDVLQSVIIKFYTHKD